MLSAADYGAFFAIDAVSRRCHYATPCRMRRFSPRHAYATMFAAARCHTLLCRYYALSLAMLMLLAMPADADAARYDVTPAA